MKNQFNLQSTKISDYAIYSRTVQSHSIFFAIYLAGSLSHHARFGFVLFLLAVMRLWEYWWKLLKWAKWKKQDKEKTESRGMVINSLASFALCCWDLSLGLPELQWHLRWLQKGFGASLCCRLPSVLYFTALLMGPRSRGFLSPDLHSLVFFIKTQKFDWGW